MKDEQRSVYGTTIAKPDEKAGVEVGGGEKAAAEKERQKPNSGTKPGSRSDSEHERRPEGPHEPDKADKTDEAR